VYHERNPRRRPTTAGRVALFAWARGPGAPCLALLGVLVSAPGCGAGAPVGAASAPAASPAGLVRPKSPAPLVRVSVQSRRHRTLQLGDRVPGFDRLSFSAPAAALYDEQRDLYWVSNSNGEGSDDNGFISRLDPAGQVVTMNFIDGSRSDVTLNSPAGIALKGDHLLVADITALREFDAETGKPLGKIEIPGAKRLSGVAVAPDGNVYVSDLGAELDVAGSDTSTLDAVYRVSPQGVLSTLSKRTALRGPSALVADTSGLWLVNVGGELVHLLAGNITAPAAAEGNGGQSYPLGLGALRGLTRVPDGTFLVSGWRGDKVWRGTPGGSFESVIDGLEAPADLGYDTRRQRLLIPLFDGHALAVFDLPPFQGKPSPASTRGSTPEPAPESAPAPAIVPPVADPPNASPAAERRGPAS
jgi:sugar lactone lactonase YvrE